MLVRCPECDTVYDIEKRILRDQGRKLKCASCSYSWFEPAMGQMAVAAALRARSDKSEPRYLSPDRDGPELASSLNVLRKIEARRPLVPLADCDRNEALAYSSRPRSAATIRSKRGGGLSDQMIRPQAQTPSRRPARAQGGVKAPFIKSHLAAMIALAMVSVSFATVFGLREPLARTYPGLVSLYGALGFDINVLGVDIRDVRFAASGQSGNPSIDVTGQLVNVSGEKEGVLPLEIILADSQGNNIYSWSFVADARALDAHQQAVFRTTIVNPPAEAQTVSIRFIQDA